MDAKVIPKGAPKWIPEGSKRGPEGDPKGIQKEVPGGTKRVPERVPKGSPKEIPKCPGRDP